MSSGYPKFLSTRPRSRKFYGRGGNTLWFPLVPRKNLRLLHISDNFSRFWTAVCSSWNFIPQMMNKIRIDISIVDCVPSMDGHNCNFFEKSAIFYNYLAKKIIFFWKQFSGEKNCSRPRILARVSPWKREDTPSATLRLTTIYNLMNFKCVICHSRMFREATYR